MERSQVAQLAMAQLAWQEHDWRYDAGELTNPDADGNDHWSRMAVRFEDGTATDEDWAEMEATFDDEDLQSAMMEV